MTSTADHGRWTNRLAQEKSPYLLQHAHNPVDWYAWSDDAFARARADDKPIFLSIGYSTCHWCHVMARESFEDEDVARRLNESFVSIKVDREERPDIDDVYMTACQLMTGQGGWPLTLFLTPDKKPFFAATYLPKAARAGRLGLLDLLPRVAALWRDRRQDLRNDADTVARHLAGPAWPVSFEGLGAEHLTAAFRAIEQTYDPNFGGFGEAPKFPTPHRLYFLLRYWRRTGEPRALAMVEHTLRAMRRGGIFDQLGYGFHRYSTDRRWLVPHFEKMLYDQALLALAYLEAYQASGAAEFAEVARAIFAYVRDEMTDADGGFHSAEDADSEGREGKFYVWTADELRQALGESDAALAASLFGARRDGNFLDEASGSVTGANVLHRPATSAEATQRLGRDPAARDATLAAIRQKLLAARARRVRPHKDDKILTAWNGLMIAALARGARVLDDPLYAAAAARAARFVQQRMTKPDGGLWHSYRDGQAGIDGFLDDYAFLAWGLLELYEADFDPQWLHVARRLVDLLLTRFWDEPTGGFFLTAHDAESLPARPKRFHDGALPSGNSVALLVLLKLARVTGEARLEEAATRLIHVAAGALTRLPGEFTLFWCGVDFALGPSYELVIAGESQAADTRALVRAARQTFAPNLVVLLKAVERDNAALRQVAPQAAIHSTRDGQATAYLCRQWACEAPITEASQLSARLQPSRAAAAGR